MARFQLVSEVAGCHGDDLEAALNEPLSSPVGLELLKRYIPDRLTDALDSLYHVDETRYERTRHD